MQFPTAALPFRTGAAVRPVEKLIAIALHITCERRGYLCEAAAVVWWLIARLHALGGQSVTFFRLATHQKKRRAR